MSRSPCHQGSSSPSWSDLPLELLRAIANRLKPNNDDFQRFRTVCKNWRLAAHPLQLYAVLPRNVYPNYDNSFSSTAVYLLRQRSISSSAARNTWLITVEQSNDGTLRLLHLLTGRPVENLPQEFLTNFLYNVDYTREITRTFDLKYSNNNNNMLNEISVLNDKIPYKVILWPNPKVKSPAGPRDYSYVVFQEGSHPKNNIRCFRTTPENHTTENHRYIAYGLQTRFEDIVHWKGLICAVDSSGKLYGISYKTMNLVTVFVTTYLSLVEHQQCRLAVWKGKMYLVRQRHATITVYELNEKRYLWDELTTLGDLILFVRPENCFFVQASYLPGCQGNCVVIIPSFDKKKSKAKTITRRASQLFEGAGGYVKVRVYKYGDGGKVLD